MYQMLSKADLAKVLNQFSVPMFAVERQSTMMPFKVTFLNDAMQAALAHQGCNLTGRTLHDLLPQEEHDDLIARLCDCASTREVTRFRGRFSLMSKAGKWDVTLQPSHLLDGRQRIVATAIAECPATGPQPSTVTFEDIQYFSSMADYQIQNLITLFESLENETLFETAAEQRIARLGGMCRTVQRAVADIQKSVQNARLQELSGAIHTGNVTELRSASSLDRCGTLKVLKEFSTEQTG